MGIFGFNPDRSKNDLSDVVRTADIADVVRTADIADVVRTGNILILTGKAINNRNVNSVFTATQVQTSAAVAGLRYQCDFDTGISSNEWYPVVWTADPSGGAGGEWFTINQSFHRSDNNTWVFRMIVGLAIAATESAPAYLGPAIHGIIFIKQSASWNAESIEENFNYPSFTYTKRS